MIRAMKLGPCAASVSASAAVASPAVVTVEGVCVIFSTPTTRARSTSPDPTAWTPARKAAPPDPHAASILKASTPFRPHQSAIWAPRLSCEPGPTPESMLETINTSGRASRWCDLEASGWSEDGAELVSVDEHAPLAIFADLPGGHLDRRADPDRLVPEVGELGRDHRAFFKSDHSDGVGGIGLVAGGGVVDGGVGVDLAAPAELVFCARLTAAIGADVPRRKDLHVAVRAHLAHQGVTLLAKPPMP